MIFSNDIRPSTYRRESYAIYQLEYPSANIQARVTDAKKKLTATDVKKKTNSDFYIKKERLTATILKK